MFVSIGGPRSLFGSLLFVSMLLNSLFVDSSISCKLVPIGGGRFEGWLVVPLVE